MGNKAVQVKSCDYSGETAAWVLTILNPEIVKVARLNHTIVVVTDEEPRDLIYPEGWYYAKGNLRNKHFSTTGFYDEVMMVFSDGKPHKETYCTLYD